MDLTLRDSEPAANPADQRLELAEALMVGGIHFDVPGDDKTSVLGNIVSFLPLRAPVDRTYLLDVLIARETMGSTGVGNGIAIPHARNPMALSVDAPVATLCFLQTSIDFGAADQQRVDKIFLLICPTIAAHLRLLARLSQLLKDERLIAAMNAKKSADHLFEIVRRVEAGLIAQKPNEATRPG